MPGDWRKWTIHRVAEELDRLADEIAAGEADFRDAKMLERS